MSTKVVEVEGHRFPAELYYTDRHLWVRKEADGILTLGMDDLGQRLAGRITIITLMETGQAIVAGKALGIVESMKWVERIRSPVTGIITETNNRVVSKPQTVNEDPYGQGWMVKVKPTRSPDEELSKLTTGEAIRDWVKNEVREKVKPS